MKLISYAGFKFETNSENPRIKLVMPDALSDIFFASLYLRSTINDMAAGDPSTVWMSMSHMFNGCGLVAPHQVHGTDIIDAKSDFELPIRFSADGIYLEESSESLASLRFADCTPVVIAGAIPKPWMFILHSGFVGTVKNISSSAVRYLKDKLGAADMNDALAWVLPGISFRCYGRRRADAKTAEAQKIFSEDNMYIEGETVYFDIHGQIRHQLLSAGIHEENIFVCDDCTCCNSKLYYSYRAGDTESRLFLLAGRLPQTMRNA